MCGHIRQKPWQYLQEREDCQPLTGRTGLLLQSIKVQGNPGTQGFEGIYSDSSVFPSIGFSSHHNQGLDFGTPDIQMKVQSALELCHSHKEDLSRILIFCCSLTIGVKSLYAAMMTLCPACFVLYRSYSPSTLGCLC